MTLNKFVFKTHKWLAVGTLLAVVFWFISGVVIVTPDRFFGSRRFSEKAQTGEPELRDAKIGIAQAVAVVDEAAGSPQKIARIELRKLGGRLAYELETAKREPILVDAMDGSRIVIDEEFAKQLVRRFAGQDARILQVTMIREHGNRYNWGPLPVWHVSLDDSRNTSFFVDVQRGRVSSNDWYGRIRQWLVGFHTFAFMESWFPGKAAQVTMWVFSFAGTVMIFFGCWILWIQWKLWLAARRARAA